MRGGYDIGGNQRVLGISEGVLELAFSSFLQGGVNLFNGYVAGSGKRQVGSRAGDNWNTHGVAIQLAFQLRQYQGDSLSCAGGGRHHIYSSGAGAARILVRCVLDALVAGVGVDGGHQALFDAELVIEDLCHRRQAVGGAGCCGNNIVVCRIVGVRVNAIDEGSVYFLARSRDDDLLSASLEVSLGVIAIGETAGGLDHEVYVVFAPLELLRVLLRGDHDAVTVNGNGFIIMGNLAIEAAQYGVVLEQVSQRTVIGQVVYCNNFEVVVALSDCTEKVAADTAKAIDTYADSHCISPQRVE